MSSWEHYRVLFSLRTDVGGCRTCRHLCAPSDISASPLCCHILGASRSWSMRCCTAISFIFLIQNWRDRPRIFPIIHLESSKKDLITRLCTRKREEQKDKAFDFHAILQRLSKIDLPDPDSTRELEEIYKEMTVSLIDLTESLRILAQLL